jgi:hypothetical protein
MVLTRVLMDLRVCRVLASGGNVGRPCRDRAVDAPACRIHPLGKGLGLVLRGTRCPQSRHRVSQRPFEAVASAEEGCGLIAYGQLDSLNDSEIRRIPCSLSLERRPFAGSLQRRGRSVSLRGPGELFNPEACETGGLGLTVSRGAVRWNTTETPLRERV